MSIPIKANEILILRGRDIASLLASQEADLIHVVKESYEAHFDGHSSLPHSVFLRFPSSESNRIIALPAYLETGEQITGIKWVASFPDNLSIGLNRASALIILNSTITGRPEAILEGSLISAKRTAASAALAASVLCPNQNLTDFGLVGCGIINFEIARFILSCFSKLNHLLLFDIDYDRMKAFEDKCIKSWPFLRITPVDNVNRVLSSSSLTSFATTATAPYIHNLSICPTGSLILNISLRDISASAILSCENVVDDIDHVCREQTSVHLAEQLSGNRDFIKCTLAEITSGRVTAREENKSVMIFSPFGLGILDLAVAKVVVNKALSLNVGIKVSPFFPDCQSL